MIDIKELLNKNFNNKYNFLKFYSIVYEEKLALCTITFLYPYTIDEISGEDKKEIEDFIKNYLNLNGEVKVKLKKSYLDARLILDDIVKFFEQHKKGLLPYISLENISIQSQKLDVNIQIKLNQDIVSLIDDFELKSC